jgi:ribonucleoside-diphosphate reductase alpha chain
MDYIIRWLASKFLDLEAQRAVGVILRDDLETSAPPSAITRGITQAFLNQQDAPPCHVCGLIMVRCGACYQCLNCGATSGCG